MISILPITLRTYGEIPCTLSPRRTRSGAGARACPPMTARSTTPPPAVPARAGPGVHARRLTTRRRLPLAGLQLIVLLISAAIIYALVRKVNPAQVVSKAGHVSWRLVGVAMALNLVTTLLRARRSQILLKRLGQHVPFVRTTWVDLAGQTLSWLTPAASGDFSRPLPLAQSRPRSRSSAAGDRDVRAAGHHRPVGIVGGVLAAAIYLPALERRPVCLRWSCA